MRSERFIPEFMCFSAVNCGPAPQLSLAIMLSSSSVATTFGSSITYICPNDMQFARGVFGRTLTCGHDAKWTSTSDCRGRPVDVEEDSCKRNKCFSCEKRAGV